MVGIGIDLCTISRIERILREHPSFLKRFYSEDEIVYLESQCAGRTESAAAMFAAKEAFLKAAGIGINGKVALSEISVAHAQNGRPYYRLTGGAEKVIQELGARQVHLSISHEGDTSAAVCLLE